MISRRSLHSVSDKGEINRSSRMSSWTLASRVFGWEIEEIVGATARYYGKTNVQMGMKRRGEANGARAMAMNVCRRLGGHKLREIGQVVGLEKYSLLSTAY